MSTIEIIRVTSPIDVAAVADLFREYAWVLNREHGLDICFQDFAGEMATFPDRYEFLLLARVEGAPAAAVALKPLAPGECEMKRLYARAAFRGLRLGEQLVERLIGEARARRYTLMRLDTHASLGHAIRLYESFGFLPSEPHNVPESPSIMYFARPL
jgi:putative acetyltransferase